MKRFLLASILIGSILGSLLGCNQRKKEEDLSGPVRVQIPFSMDGKYSLQVIELFTLENLVALKGLAAKFLIDPDTVSGQLQGRSPELRYIQDGDGIIVPKDNLSLQLLTVYAHFEKMRELDQKLGVADKLVWPATVAINARYKTADGTLVNNALYSGEHDALLMVPYVGEDLPIMVNAGVLAHEHFHNIFQKLVIEPLEKTALSKRMTIHDESKMLELFKIAQIADKTQAIDEKAENKSETESQVDETSSKEDDAEEAKHAEAVRQIYHEVLMRGINEGFADVWGWVYSGDDSFVGKSLPKEKSNRELNVLISEMRSMSEIKEAILNVQSSGRLLGYSYTLGTEYARMVRNYAGYLKEAQGLNSEKIRNQIGSLILKVLPLLEKKYESLEKNAYLAPSDIIKMFMTASEKLDSKQCFYFAKMIPDSERSDETEKRCQALESQEATEGQNTLIAEETDK